MRSKQGIQETIVAVRVRLPKQARAKNSSCKKEGYSRILWDGLLPVSSVLVFLWIQEISYKLELYFCLGKLNLVEHSAEQRDYKEW